MAPWRPPPDAPVSRVPCGCAGTATPYDASLSDADLDALIAFVAAQLPEGAELATEHDGSAAADGGCCSHISSSAAAAAAARLPRSAALGSG